MASNCQIPTPKTYVIQMLDYIGYTDKLFGKKVLENSCGEGNILLEIVRRYVESAKKENRAPYEIKEGLKKDIIAYEVDEMKDYIAMDGLLEELEKIMFENKE